MMPINNDTIAHRLNILRAELPSGVRLIAVSKFHPAEDLRAAYRAGQRLFGENRVQEMVAKHEELAAELPELQWHFIGTLQTNKVKYIVPFVTMIQSVSSEKLLHEIERRAVSVNRKIDILLEVHVAEEDTKSGFGIREAQDMAHRIFTRPEDFAHIRLCGLMTMATNTDNQNQIRAEFRSVAAAFQEIRSAFPTQDSFCELSMGMSHDYPIAIEENATLIRVGTKIFGKRNYGQTP